ncbi:hypothetical protein GGR57DRAFT_372395 [Xylariaceae sp. FL1272]|nr:hypothetical protein GGR57DRAFT_372395 [Xylariaceae sp. FL1272]
MGCPTDVAIAIGSKVCKYGEYLDTKQWDKFASEVLLPECQWFMVNQEGEPLRFKGKDLTFSSTPVYLDHFSKMLKDFNSTHMFGVGSYELVGSDTVKHVCTVEDQLVSKSMGQWVELRGGGYFYTTWKLRDGEWRCQDVTLKRHYQNMSPIVRFAVWLESWGLNVM